MTYFSTEMVDFQRIIRHTVKSWQKDSHKNMKNCACQILKTIIFLAILFSSCTKSQPANPDQAIVHINPLVKYQTITGWEADAEAGQTSPGFEKYKELLFDDAVNDLGINRLRLEIKSGLENSKDYWSDFRAGRIDYKKWRCVRYSTINDNDDPFVINNNGFQFSEMDFTVENVVLPLKKILKAKGERLYINLLYVAFTRQICDNLEYHHDDSLEEYAEFILATFLHLKEKYNFVPDALEVILEPDNTDFWSGTKIGEAIVATSKRLKENGFYPDFIAPSNTNMKKAIKWFDDMIKVPGVLKHLTEFSYHRYGGVSDSNLKKIANRAEQYNINTSMLEHIGSGYEDLHDDLKMGRNSAWQQYTLAYPTNNDNGAKYYTIDISNPDNPSIQIGSRTKFLRQYFKFIRSGAVRIEATSNNDDFDPLVFINKDSHYVIVIKAEKSGTIIINELPEGLYGIKYTTTNEYNIDLPDVKIKIGEVIQTKMPNKGVITIYSKS